jgi:methionyl-tRNA synthetase
MKKFYITTPIYYPNARPHVGSAYTTIVCDAIARYKHMCGYDVAFLTGTDEHGEKLQRAADAAGKSPAEFVAEKRKLFTKLWDTLGIPPYSAENTAGYRFVHTSQNAAHRDSVWWMIRQARDHQIPYCARCESYLEHGTTPARCPKCDGPVEFPAAIYKRKYEGRYCIHDERYVSDNTEPANCDICGRPAELISEENYFFRLSAFQERLLKLYEDHPEFVLPDFRMNEVRSFVKSGLRDISISRRRLKWGIPWPDDPEQVVYVWYDALTSYLTGIGFRGLDKTGPDSDFHKYWMDAEAERVHMIGKDILRFHAVYWPAFLMAAGLPLPKTIFAHGWIYYEQDKMSKSKGNVVYPEPIVEALNSFGVPGNDALRYYLLRDTPFGQDASFSYEGLIRRYNSDLANDLGNLANRTFTMVHRFSGGTIPVALRDASPREDIIRATAEGHRDFYSTCFSKYELSRAIEYMWDLVADVNKYIRDVEPWTLASSSAAESKMVLSLALCTAAEALRFLIVTLHPVLPEGTRRLWGQLGCSRDLGPIEEQRIGRLVWGQVKSGTKVAKPEPIFPRLDKEKTLAKLHELAEADYDRDKPKEALKSVEPETPKAPESPSSTGFQPVKEDTVGMAVVRAPNAQPPAPGTPNLTPGGSEKISIADFAKVEMRVGEVVSAERIPKADKLLKVMVDIGTEVRQVCAGIAEYYPPEQLVGMKVVVVTNLAPRKLRGVESNGMMVAASAGEEGRPVLVTFKEDVPNGARLK